MRDAEDVAQRSYETYEELLEAEANGFVAVVLMVNTRNDYHFARVVGPYETRREAKNKTVSLRRLFKKHDPEYAHVRLLGAHVEPVWKDMK